MEQKTLFDCYDIKYVFRNFFTILACVLDDNAPIKKFSKKEKSLIDKPWIDNYLWYLMRVRDTFLLNTAELK